MQNCHGKDPEWKGISVFSEPQVRLHSAKKISFHLLKELIRERTRTVCLTPVRTWDETYS